ncbi:hypothetical protein QFC21_002759 [Naganishia friedmannii]|uniref:Uncharacterized protein n=1 Tax=Naganishia friedmannii TaxID=89922 RepID=A0ACC2VTN4_9TREE|nr:hypothetical protein QFC21_002759 [Naganishia friedmannii]
MSRTAKSFLVASIAITTATVWGVHFIQAREEEAMYQGVVKDEARMLARAARNSSTAPPTNATQTPATYTGPTVAPPTIPLSARRAEYSRNLALQQSLEEEQGMERARKEKEAYEKDREEVRRKGL